MRAAGLLDRGPAGQAVGDHVAAGGEVALGQRLDLLLAEALDHCEPQPPGLALGRRVSEAAAARTASLAGGTAARACRPRAPAEIGVVDLDPAGEPGLPGLARFHRRHQLVLEQPGGRLARAQPARQLDRRHPALALGQVVDRQEPRRQRQFGPVEHRPGGQPDLVLAAVALPDGTAGERSTAAMAAGRADPALAPSAAARLIRLRRSGGPRAAEGEREQRRAALRLGPEPGAEPRLAQPLDPPPQPTLAAHPTASRTPRTRAAPPRSLRRAQPWPQRARPRWDRCAGCECSRSCRRSRPGRPASAGAKRDCRRSGRWRHGSNW